MSDTVIKVENLGKKYILSHRQEGRSQYRALRDVIADGAKSVGKRILGPFGDESVISPDKEEFWALKDVSFEIKRGDRVGIIGHNGAGKSTLLKVLSRITEPTSGKVSIQGRIASLLEVGTGFHPELTGRENIFLNGAVLGMGKTEIKRKFDEIVDFAEIEKFLDTPVKRYSSGMYVRLAFAVAAHLEPEILLVDEVLAVGDIRFQDKCLGKMQEVGDEGRTVIFVSHNMHSISLLTNYCLLLSEGKKKYVGSTDQAINLYLTESAHSELVYYGEKSDFYPTVSKVEVCTSKPENIHVFGEEIIFDFEIHAPNAISGACLSFQVINHLKIPIIHLWLFDSEQPLCREPGIFRLTCTIPRFRLYMGKYTVSVYFSEPPGGTRFQTIEAICPFEVTMYGHYREFKWQPESCAYLEDCGWSVEQLS